MIPYDHTAILEEIWTQFQNKPRIRAVIERMLAEPANEAEILLTLALRHNIVDATGLELDDLGAMLDLPRDILGGLDDDAYRAALIIRGRSVFAGGTIPDFTDLLRAILPDHGPIPVIEWFPAAVRVYLENITPEQGNIMKALLTGVLPAAGVNTVIAVHDDDTLTFSSSHGPVTLQGWFGSSHGPTANQDGWAHAIKI